MHEPSTITQFDSRDNTIDAHRFPLLPDELLLKRRHNSDVLVNRLPADILYVVFDHVVFTNGVFDHFRVTTIVSVCSAWREYALEYGSLWAHIRYLPTVARQIASSFERAISYLRRSKSSLLYIEISLKSDINDAQTLTKLRSLIIPHLPRCRSLLVQADARSAHYVFPLPSPTPSLKKLAIELFHEGLPSPISIFPQNSQCTLETFSFEAGTVRKGPGWTFGAESIDSSRITSMEFWTDTSVTPAIMDLLARSPRLELLEASLRTRITNEVADSRVSIELPNLRSLELRGSPFLIQNLTSKSLRHLDVLFVGAVANHIGGNGEPSAFPNIRSLKIPFGPENSAAFTCSLIQAHRQLVVLDLTFRAVPVTVHLLTSVLAEAIPPSSSSSLRLVRIYDRGDPIVDSILPFSELFQLFPNIRFQITTPKPAIFLDVRARFQGRVEVASSFQSSIAELAEDISARLDE